MTENSLDGSFFRAISAVHRNEHFEARRFIDRSRHLLDTKLTALVGESYNRAYNVMVRVQQLSELEEVIEYKRSNDAARRATIRRIWDVRLMGCQRDGSISLDVCCVIVLTLFACVLVDTWQQLLAVRSMVVPPRDDMDIWLKFAGLCRKSGKRLLCWFLIARNNIEKLTESLVGRLRLSHKTLTKLMGNDPSVAIEGVSSLPTSYPRVTFAYIKQL